MYTCVYVFVEERDRVRNRESEQVCFSERDGESERDRERERDRMGGRARDRLYIHFVRHVCTFGVET